MYMGAGRSLGRSVLNVVAAAGFLAGSSGCEVSPKERVYAEETETGEAAQSRATINQIILGSRQILAEMEVPVGDSADMFTVETLIERGGTVLSRYLTEGNIPEEVPFETTRLALSYSQRINELLKTGDVVTVNLRDADGYTIDSLTTTADTTRMIPDPPYVEQDVEGD